MKKQNNFFSAVGGFFKKNAYYVVLFICIAGIAAMITLAALSGNKPIPVPPDDGQIINPPDDQTPVDTVISELFAPVSDFTLGFGHDNSTSVYYEMVKGHYIHTGLDFNVARGTEVKAAYGGTVLEIKQTNSTLLGYTIVIKHNEDLTTTYNAEFSDLKVKAGDTVEAGQVMGYVAETSLKARSLNAEANPHLHFEVFYKNTSINPLDYLDIGDK